MQAENISLYFKDARSDKEYHVQLKEQGEGFVVAYQNGKRGGTLAQGLKTPTPVGYEKAKQAYDETVKAKTKKGYSPGESGIAFQDTALEQRATGIVPQLLNPISEAEVNQYINDPRWVAQEKHDGHRRLVHRSSVSCFGVNRTGLSLGLTDTVVKALEALKDFGSLTVDGELMGSKYVIFDVLEANGEKLTHLPYSRRLLVLDQIGAVLTKAGITEVRIVKTAYTTAEKQALHRQMQALKREGTVFKNIDAAYVPGRPNSLGDQLKRVFWKRATLIVTKPSATKRSVSFHALDDEGRRIPLGNVTIPSNYDIPLAGALIEVEYKYAFLGGSLFQPQYKGLRDDIALDACTTGQLHYFQPEEGEADED